MRTFTDGQSFVVKLARTSPTYDELSVLVVTSSTSNIAQYALDYVAALYPTYTYTIKSLEKMGLTVLTDS